MDGMRTVHGQSASSRFATVRGLALATLCFASLAVSAAMADDADPPRSGGPAIPSGEERLIGEMLGKGTRIEKCKLIRSRVEYTVITATYKCPEGRVRLELCHRTNATEPSLLTEQFAITLQSGSPPLGFQDALVSRIRSREADFVWTWAEHAAVTDTADDERSVSD